VGTPELAAAVSEAGGLGLIAIHNAGSPEQGREWIRQLKRLTKKPFGVNLTILPTMGPPPPYEEYARVIIEEGVKIVETAGSNPKKWIRMFKDAGLITIHKCIAIRHALSAEKLGCDIISLDGFECAVTLGSSGPALPRSTSVPPLCPEGHHGDDNAIQCNMLQRAATQSAITAGPPG
jgi:NAD(P)H-dependent flavin oxidoreductase YrpB (nitropropane dioxygenase family)